MAGSALTSYGLLAHGYGAPATWTDREGIDTDTGRLVALPGRTVRLTTIEDGATLALSFDGGEPLRAVADTELYECYRLPTAW
jgi:hypothetical protein